MGLVKTEITLKNTKDMFKVEFGLIPEQEIRQMTVTSFVDTGAWTLVINEATRKKLGLDYSKACMMGVRDIMMKIYGITDKQLRTGCKFTT